LRDPVAGAESATHVLVEHAELAGFLTLAFEAVWARATPHEDYGINWCRSRQRSPRAS